MQANGKIGTKNWKSSKLILYLFRHLLCRCAAQLFSCGTAAFCHTAADVAQQVGVDGVC